MKLIYISGKYIDEELPGVKKKINDQIKVLKEKRIIVEKTTVSKLPRLLRVLPFSSTFDWKYLKLENADILYIRMEPFSFPFLRFLKRYKKMNPSAKIIIEIASYPYDEEIKKLNILTQKRDKLYRKGLKSYVDRITSYSNDTEIFGIPVIGIQNGIDVDAIPIAKKRAQDNEIHLIAVAALQPYHAYERVINGLYDYYQNGGQRLIKIFVVGDGEEKDNLQKLMQDRGLERNITFFGRKTGADLTEVYDQADIGLGSFGLYKRGISSWSSALKTREYLARGLPVISGCTEDVFQGKNVDFYLELENNEKPLDFCEIENFFDRIYSKKKSEVSQEIRQFAKENVDVRNTFSPVIRYIKE